jgi:hypothetical protein
LNQPHRSRPYVTTRNRPAKAMPIAPGQTLDLALRPTVDVLATAAREVTSRAFTTGVLAFATEDGIISENVLYAAMGAVTVGQYAAVRGTLAVLFGAQREDGRVPSRMGLRRGWRARVAAWFGRPDRALTTVAYGQGLVPTALALWASAVYVEATGDRQFLQDHKSALQRAGAWLEARQVDGLPALAGEPPSLLAGVLCYRALLALGELAVPQGDAVAAARHWARAANLRERVNAAFWDAGLGHYTEAALGKGRANLLAVAVNLAAHGQAQAILAQTDDGFALEAGSGFLALAASAQGDFVRARAAHTRGSSESACPAEAGRLLLALAEAMPTEALAR